MTGRGVRRAAAVLVLVLLAARPEASTAAAMNHPGDLPDPAVLTVGGTYFAYGTQSGGFNIPVMASYDLVHWAGPIDALPYLPRWALPGRTWAPAVTTSIAGNVMWYTVRHRASGRQCISVALSPNPAGTFVDLSTGPRICQLDRAGSIDPDVFVDPNGTPYLLWKSEDNAKGQPTRIWAAALDVTRTRIVGKVVNILTQSALWQAGGIEGPTMAFSGNGFHLFYGAGDWNSARAGIGYATCASPLGPCADATTGGPWVASSPGALGPSGPHVMVDHNRTLRLAYHAWNGCVGYPDCKRSLWTGALQLAGGQPHLGP